MAPWDKNLEQRLRDICDEVIKNGGDRDNLKNAILKDKKLKKIGWGACEKKAERMDLLEKIPPASIWPSDLEKKLKELYEKFTDIDQLKLEISKVDELKEKGLGACERKARREGWLKKKPASVDDDIWKTNFMRSKVASLIGKRILRDGGIDGLLVALNKWLKDKSLEVTKDALQEHLDQLIWTSGRFASLEEFVRFRVSIELIYQIFSTLPKNLIDLKIQELKGHSASKSDLNLYSQAGVGRLMITEEIAKGVEFKLRETTRENPLVIEVQNPNNWDIVQPNAPHIGVEYNPLFSENPLKNLFIHAQKNNSDAIIITGGLMWMDLERSQGRLTTHRAMISGSNFQENVMDPDYRDEAIRIRKELPPNEVAFSNKREEFHNLLGGWAKIALDDNGKPIFSRKIYLCFGRQEENLIEACAHAEVLYIVTVQRIAAAAERCKLERQQREAASDGDEKEVIRLQQEIDKLIKLEVRMRQTNVMHEDRRRFVDIYRSYIISQYQQKIPNCEVIAQGTTFISVGGKVGEIHQDREEITTDSFLNKFMKTNAGRRGLELTMPDFVLLASSYSKNMRFALSEYWKNKEQRTSIPIWQLPVAIDKEYLKTRMKTTIRKASPIERLIRDDQFEPGVFQLRCVNGLLLPELLSIKMLSQLQKKNGKKNGNGANGYTYIFVASDQHWGHPWKKFVYNPRKENYLDLEEAAMEILRRDLLEKNKPLPFHGYIGLGDRTQGHHFETQAQPHPRVMRYSDFEQTLNNICADSKVDKKHLKEIALEQIRLRGEHWPQSQVQECLASLARNTDFFTAILQRNLKSGVKFTGIGKGKDSRDIGVITDIDGNHFKNTFEGNLTEFFYANELINLIGRQLPDLSLTDLRQLIRAPLHGNTAIGLGTVMAPNGYEWGLSLRHDPSRKSGSNGDPLLEAPKNILERGPFANIFAGRETIHLSADIHRFGFVKVPNVTVISCACGTDSDPYGERGFSLNNMGVMVVGIPAKGPGHGPIKMIVLNHDFIEKELLQSSGMNWDEVFKDAV